MVSVFLITTTVVNSVIIPLLCLMPLTILSFQQPISNSLDPSLMYDITSGGYKRYNHLTIYAVHSDRDIDQLHHVTTVKFLNDRTTVCVSKFSPPSIFFYVVRLEQTHEAI